MAQQLVAGQNCVVPGGALAVIIRSGKPADFSCFRLYAGGKTRQDSDFVFYGQKRNEDGSITLLQDSVSATFAVNLPALAKDAEKVAFAVTSDFPTIAYLGSLSMDVLCGASRVAECSVDMNGRDEAALILGELYRRGAEWKFRFVAQGFRGGLKPLAEFYGVDVADDAPQSSPQTAPKPEPAPASKINLSKVTLTKEKPRIDLAKHEAVGVYRVNLNWNQRPVHGQGLMGRLFGSSAGIDLDLGAFVRLKDGSADVVQALGNTFGSLDRPPYVKLLGDDRTGAQADGEWLEINGAKIDEIDEVLIYTFIYEGVPNWQATDAVVRVMIAGHPEIETRVSEGNDARPMCAIARIRNRGGNLEIERLNRYFTGQRDMDETYGWGFSWMKGRK